MTKKLAKKKKKSKHNGNFLWSTLNVYHSTKKDIPIFISKLWIWIKIKGSLPYHMEIAASQLALRSLSPRTYWWWCTPVQVALRMPFSFTFFLFWSPKVKIDGNIASGRHYNSLFIGDTQNFTVTFLTSWKVRAGEAGRLQVHDLEHSWQKFLVWFPSQPLHIYCTTTHTTIVSSPTLQYKHCVCLHHVHCDMTSMTHTHKHTYWGFCG